MCSDLSKWNKWNIIFTLQLTKSNKNDTAVQNPEQWKELRQHQIRGNDKKSRHQVFPCIHIHRFITSLLENLLML